MEYYILINDYRLPLLQIIFAKVDKKTISEIMLGRFLWTRTNTIELFRIAQNAKIMQYKPKYLIENPTENHNLLYQFQCIITSTDAHFRRLKNDDNQRSGLLTRNGVITKKQEIKEEDIFSLLQNQVTEAKQINVDYPDTKKLINAFITIYEHEVLHQGQLVIMFRETEQEFPKIFKDAWNL